MITAYTSDGRVAAFDLQIIEDPRNSMLPYDSFLLASSRAAENNRFVEIMQTLVNQISDLEMREANRLVDVEGRSVSDAIAYLQTIIHE